MSKKPIKESLEGEIYHEIEEFGNKKYAHIGFRDKEGRFGDALANFVPKPGMRKKAKITIEIYD